MNNDIKLEPCPFCGGEAKFFEDKGYQIYSVTCTECDAGTNAYGIEQDAIDAWNTRKGEAFTKSEADWILNLLVSEYTGEPLCESIIAKCEKILGTKD